MIAAHALALDLTLVSNDRVFERVEGLAAGELGGRTEMIRVLKIGYIVEASQVSR